MCVGFFSSLASSRSFFAACVRVFCARDEDAGVLRGLIFNEYSAALRVFIENARVVL